METLIGDNPPKGPLFSGKLKIQIIAIFAIAIVLLLICFIIVSVILDSKNITISLIFAVLLIIISLVLGGLLVFAYLKMNVYAESSWYAKSMAQELLERDKVRIISEQKKYYEERLQEQRNSFLEQLDREKNVFIGAVKNQVEQWKQIYTDEIKRETLLRSRATLKGKIGEHFAPLLPDFRHNPSDARFIGSPIDYVIFDGLGESNVSDVIFMDVKTGEAKLTQMQKQIKEAVDNGRVRWETLHLDVAESTEEKIEIPDIEIPEFKIDLNIHSPKLDEK